MVFVLAVLRITALVVKKIGCENLLLLVSLWLLLLLTIDCKLFTFSMAVIAVDYGL
jgi:hypothetical protein